MIADARPGARIDAAVAAPDPRSPYNPQAQSAPGIAATKCTAARSGTGAPLKPFPRNPFVAAAQPRQGAPRAQVAARATCAKLR